MKTTRRQDMANGDLAAQVDELLEREKITPNVAATLTLRMVKKIYDRLGEVSEIQEEHSGRLLALEEANRADDIKSQSLITWTWIRDKLVQPGIILFLGWFFFSFIPSVIKGF